MYLAMMTSQGSDIKVCLEDFGDSDTALNDDHKPCTTDLQHLSTESHHLGDSSRRLTGSSRSCSSRMGESAPLRCPSPSQRRFQTVGSRRKCPSVGNESKKDVSAQEKAGEQEPRQSLLGRPLSVTRPNKRDVHYRRLQAKVYNFLERPKDSKSVSYHLLV